MYVLLIVSDYTPEELMKAVELNQESPLLLELPVVDKSPKY